MAVVSRAGLLTVALAFSAHFLTEASILSRLRQIETNVVSSQAIIKSDIADLYERVKSLSRGVGIGDENGDTSLNMTAIMEALELQKARADFLEKNLAALTRRLDEMKPAVDWSEGAKTLQEAFMAEKMERKQVQRQIEKFDDSNNRQNAYIDTLAGRANVTEKKIRSLEKRISNNTQGIQTVSDTLNNELAREVNDLETALQSSLGTTENKLSETASAICKLGRLCSDWSEWGTCTAPCESLGTKSRTRSCHVENFSFCPDTELNEREEEPCKNTDSCCPEDYEKTASGYCFKLYMATKRLDEIKEFCEGQGSHLVSLTSKAKETAFIEYAKTKFSSSSWVVLIEGQRTGSEWLGRHGSPLPYTNWESGQPDEHGDCIYLTLGTAHWATAFCTGSIYTYFCEKGEW